MDLTLEKKNEAFNEENLPTEEEVKAEALSGSNPIKRFFTIARVERPLFWVLCLMFFLISYVYSVIRDMKDALVISRLDAGSIPYLKMLIVLPGNFVMIFVIQRLMATRTLSKVFSIITVFFSGFFVVYGVMSFSYMYEWFKLEPSVLYGIDPFADGKKAYMGLEWTRAFYLIFVSYLTTTIYLFAELWGSCVLSFLFMSLTNSVCTKNQNKRYTPLLLISSNIALLLSGLTMNGIKELKKGASWEFSQLLNIIVFFTMGLLSVCICLVHRYTEKPILLKKIFIPTDKVKMSGGKMKITIKESIKIMFSSKLVLAMSSMVLAYSVAVNMAEGPFKNIMSKVAVQRGVPKEEFVMETNGKNQVFTGLTVIIVLLLQFGSLMDSLGWISLAIMLPLFSVASSFFYFTLISINVNADTRDGRVTGFFNNLFGIYTPQYNFELNVGQVIVVLYKALKYAAFDICKEAISMKIDPLYRAHYKSVFDGLCGKLGKALGSGVTALQNSLTNTNDVRNSALFSMGIIVSLNVFWIISVFYLARKYNKCYKTNDNIEDERIFAMT